MSASEEDYATPVRLAIYLEIGWSDFLFERPNHTASDKALAYPNPRRDLVPPHFPLEAARFACAWAEEISLGVESLCDLGGATGRTLFELDRQFPECERLVLVEPSARFCDWSERLLSSDDALPEVPLVDRAGAPRWVSPKSRPPPIARAAERLTIVQAKLEDVRPETGFDLITCLNVVDRHPCPSGLVESLGRLMNDGGLLVLSCPFDFDEQSTPDPSQWIDDLNALFAGHDGWSHVGEDELFYEFRAHGRSWTRFSTQIVGKRWS